MCVAAAETWEAAAKCVEEMAAWDREHGLDLSEAGRSAGDHKARQYRTCARTLRLEAMTGKPHCMCHERPADECPFGGMGVRV